MEVFELNAGDLKFTKSSELRNNKLIWSKRKVESDVNLAGSTVKIETRAEGNVFRAAAVVTRPNGTRMSGQVVKVHRPVGENQYRIELAFSSGSAGTDRKEAIKQVMEIVRDDVKWWRNAIRKHDEDAEFFALMSTAQEIFEACE